MLKTKMHVEFKFFNKETNKWDIKESIIKNLEDLHKIEEFKNNKHQILMIEPW